MLAFAKFKKLALSLTPEDSTAKPTKAALQSIQHYTEFAMMKLLTIIMDFKKGRTIDVKEVQRGRHFMLNFLFSGTETKINKALLEKLPKKLAIKEMKAARTDCRVTKNALVVIKQLYADLVLYCVQQLKMDKTISKRMRQNNVNDMLCNQMLFAGCDVPTNE